MFYAFEASSLASVAYQWKLWRLVSRISVCAVVLWSAKTTIIRYLLRPGRRADYCDEFVCLCVCLEPLDRSSRNLVCSSPVAVARFSAGGGAIYYVLPVLWMTSRLPVVGRMAKHGGCTVKRLPRAALQDWGGVWRLWMLVLWCKQWRKLNTFHRGVTAMVRLCMNLTSDIIGLFTTLAERIDVWSKVRNLYHLWAWFTSRSEVKVRSRDFNRAQMPSLDCI